MTKSRKKVLCRCCVGRWAVRKTRKRDAVGETGEECPLIGSVFERGWPSAPWEDVAEDAAGQTASWSL